MQQKNKISTILTEFPTFSALAQWGVGVVFMLHMANILLELRDIFAPHVLRNVLPENRLEIERHLRGGQTLLQRVSSRGVLTLVRKTLVSACMIIIVLLVSVLLPVHCGHWLLPGLLQPLQFRLDEVKSM